jgi:transcriptional regulator with GAF, ATPase, and Fis domain
MGESGTGKELVARAIHNLSRRKGAPFVPINCGALPDHILESELFGHVRGAFTGATKDRKGRFLLADGGTIFLDEVEELSAAFQVKLLRVLQEMRFEPVGSERSVTVDVRVISATNRDLRARVERDAFREDLFYRLCVVPITLPPLRERQEDIPFLVERFLAEIKKETGKTISAVSEPAMQLLLAHRWSGNVRELINALRFASIRCGDNEEILPHHLPVEIQQATSGAPLPAAPDAVPSASASVPAPVAAPPRKEKLTVESVNRALSDAGGNKALAAKLLNISRATLYRFLDRNPLS